MLSTAVALLLSLSLPQRQHSGFNWTLGKLSREVRGLVRRVRRANAGMLNFFPAGTSGCTILRCPLLLIS